MRRSFRYGVSACVGLAALIPVYVAGYENLAVVLSIPIVYATTTALALAHWGAMPLGRPGQREPRLNRKLGAIGGGVGGFGCAALVDVSIPAALVGVGLLLFGMVLTAAEFDATTGSESEQ